ncbi:pantoate--beta-alanine ligase [Novosphingobium sp.]|uniref:pantoate--beta-alanine ligase n=1 Tax=Novosphingobium sp. TaxID=1874826 RepID=UPI0028A9743F|nr:pantoate--beta-alanine ligase [Novosphingobium sp.]
MQILHSLDPLRRAVADLRASGKIALVPTMGALHEGHLTLVREARRQADHVVVSIFVNPLQFGANEDLDKYPRQLERDCALLEAEGVALVWAPTVEAMYPQGFATNISVSGVSEGLCGASRPGHFDGVATVVCKLFHQVLPDVALFGEKDWQQLAVIRRMARDLDLVQPHVDAVIGVATVREEDGLAKSSRNAYLSQEQRAQAVVLPTAMKDAISRIEAGEPVSIALARLQETLLAGGFSAVDYAELRDAHSLVQLEERGAVPMRLLVAARIGTTRLIDNMAVAADW